MVLRDHNRQLYQRNTSRPSAKTRFSDPSEIRAFDFKGEFRRSAIYPVSTTIGINRPIFKGGHKVIVLDSSKKSVGLRGGVAPSWSSFWPHIALGGVCLQDRFRQSLPSERSGDRFHRLGIAARQCRLPRCRYFRDRPTTATAQTEVAIASPELFSSGRLFVRPPPAIGQSRDLHRPLACWNQIDASRRSSSNHCHGQPISRLVSKTRNEPIVVYSRLSENGPTLLDLGHPISEIMRSVLVRS